MLGCNLCLKPNLFDSKEEQAIGFAKHQDDECKNIIGLPHKSIGLFVPYFGEDLIDNTHLKDFPTLGEPYQSYVTQYIDPKGIVYERYISSLLSDDNKNMYDGPQELPKDNLQYDIKIQYVDEDMEPLMEWKIQDQSMENTAIMANSMYKQNKQLAEYINNEDGYVLWAKNINNIEVPKEGGFLKFSINDKIAPLVGLYAFELSGGLNSWKPMQRKTPLQKINQIKFNSSGYVPSTLETYRLSDEVTGNQLRLTFDVPRDKEGSITSDNVKLVDMEYFVNEQCLEPNHHLNNQLESDDHFYHIVKFSTDANNLEQVTGLVAALSDRIADGTLTGNHIIKQYNMISSYRDQLERGEIDGPTLQINATVQQATNQLWESIGRAAWKKRMGKWSINLRENRQTARDKIKMEMVKDAKTLENMINDYLDTAKVDQRNGKEAGQWLARAEFGLSVYKDKFMKQTGKFGTDGDYNALKLRQGIYETLLLKYQELSQKEDEITAKKQGERSQKRKEKVKKFFGRTNASINSFY